MIRFRRRRRAIARSKSTGSAPCATSWLRWVRASSSLDLDTSMPNADRAALAEYEQAIASYDQANGLLIGDPSDYQVQQARAATEAGQAPHRGGARAAWRPRPFRPDAARRPLAELAPLWGPRFSDASQRRLALDPVRRYATRATASALFTQLATTRSASMRRAPALRAVLGGPPWSGPAASCRASASTARSPVYSGSSTPSRRRCPPSGWMQARHAQAEPQPDGFGHLRPWISIAGPRMSYEGSVEERRLAEAEAGFARTRARAASPDPRYRWSPPSISSASSTR